MTELTKPRRARGTSPRGDFEHSKQEALTVIEARREADREKTERLKRLREERQAQANR